MRLASPLLMTACLLSNGMSSMTNRTLLLPGLMASVLALSGCGAGSSNLDNPVTGPATSCTGEKCTAGIFSPVVEDLDYKCANISAETAPNGYFSCPVDEVVTFQIAHPSIAFTVRLGSFVMKKAFNGADDQRYFVTPRNLAGTASTTTISNREQNITALLQALDSNLDQTPDQPSDQIDLSDADKLAFLTALGRSLDLELDLAPAAFAAEVNPALVAAGRPVLPSQADARALLGKSVNGTVAGVYYSFIPLGSSEINYILFLAQSLGGIGNVPGFIGQSGSNNLLGHLALGVDRRGRMFGFGEYVKGVDLSTAALEYLDVRAVAAEELAVAESGNALLWPYNGNLKGLSFDLQNSNRITVSQGVVERGAMASTTAQYTDTTSDQYYGLGTVAESSTKLGTWSATGTVPGGRINLYRSGFVFPVLSPAVWDNLTFPLHVTASVYKSNAEGGSCTDPACLLKAVPMTILADGNIVTDGNGEVADCAGVDSLSLYDGTATELPMGVVNRAFTATDTGTTAALDVSILLPVNTFSDKRRHVEIGSSLLGVAMIRLTDLFAVSSTTDNVAYWQDFLSSDSAADLAGRVVFAPRTCI